MMLGFANNPPGAIPPPSISPANTSEKYDRPKEAHSSSNNSSLQQVKIIKNCMKSIIFLKQP